MSPKSDDAPALMSMLEAASWLGFRGANRGQRLRRILRRLEIRQGRKIMVRQGGQVRPKYLVTQSAIRTACPQLFQSHDPVIRGFREVKGTLSHLGNAVDDLATKVMQLSTNVRAGTQKRAT